MQQISEHTIINNAPTALLNKGEGRSAALPGGMHRLLRGLAVNPYALTRLVVGADDPVGPENVVDSP